MNKAGGYVIIMNLETHLRRGKNTEALAVHNMEYEYGVVVLCFVYTSVLWFI